MARPERRYVIEQRGVGVFSVLSTKFRNTGGGTFTAVSTDTYEVSGGECSCKGFAYRKSCKHTKQADKFEVKTLDPVDQATAEGVAERISARLESFVDGKIKIDEYVKDPYGEVVTIKMHARSREELDEAKTMVTRIGGVRIEFTLQESA